jgi:FAD/FMN-containing dehydrogenase
MHGTNIYFQIGAMPKPDVEDAERVHRLIWDIIMEVTLKHGGSIGHHHGVGKHRSKYIKDEHGSSYSLMEGIKNCFDPNHIMNPGVIIEDKR